MRTVKIVLVFLVIAMLVIKAKSSNFLSPQQAAMYYGISPCGTDFALHGPNPEMEQKTGGS